GLSIYHGSIGQPVSRHFAWSDIASVAIVQDFPFGERKRKEALLKVRNLRGEEAELRLSAIRSIEERRALVESLKTHARTAIDAEDLARIVRASDVQDIPFTQLWSESLRSSVPRSSSSVLSPGSLLQEGRFLIKDQIGGGGQGAVYLAEMLDECDQRM